MMIKTGEEERVEGRGSHEDGAQRASSAMTVGTEVCSALDGDDRKAGNCGVKSECESGGCLQHRQRLLGVGGPFARRSVFVSDLMRRSELSHYECKYLKQADSVWKENSRFVGTSYSGYREIGESCFHTADCAKFGEQVSSGSVCVHDIEFAGSQEDEMWLRAGVKCRCGVDEALALVEQGWQYDSAMMQVFVRRALRCLVEHGEFCSGRAQFLSEGTMECCSRHAYVATDKHVLMLEAALRLGEKLRGWPLIEQLARGSKTAAGLGGQTQASVIAAANGILDHHWGSHCLCLETLVGANALYVRITEGAVWIPNIGTVRQATNCQQLVEQCAQSYVKSIGTKIGHAAALARLGALSGRQETYVMDRARAICNVDSLAVSVLMRRLPAEVVKRVLDWSVGVGSLEHRYQYRRDRLLERMMHSAVLPGFTYWGHHSEYEDNVAEWRKAVAQECSLRGLTVVEISNSTDPHAMSCKDSGVVYTAVGKDELIDLIVARQKHDKGVQILRKLEELETCDSDMPCVLISPGCSATENDGGNWWHRVTFPVVPGSCGRYDKETGASSPGECVSYPVTEVKHTLEDSRVCTPIRVYLSGMIHGVSRLEVFSWGKRVSGPSSSLASSFLTQLVRVGRSRSWDKLRSLSETMVNTGVASWPDAIMHSVGQGCPGCRHDSNDGGCKYRKESGGAQRRKDMFVERQGGHGSEQDHGGWTVVTGVDDQTELERSVRDWLRTLRTELGCGEEFGRMPCSPVQTAEFLLSVRQGVMADAPVGWRVENAVSVFMKFIDAHDLDLRSNVIARPAKVSDAVILYFLGWLWGWDVKQVSSLEDWDSSPRTLFVDPQGPVQCKTVTARGGGSTGNP